MRHKNDAEHRKLLTIDRYTEHIEPLQRHITVPCRAKLLRYLLHMLESIFDIVRGELVFTLLRLLRIDVGHTKTRPFQRSRLRCNMIVQHVDDVPALSIHSWCVYCCWWRRFVWVWGGWMGGLTIRYSCALIKSIVELLDVSDLFDDFSLSLSFHPICTTLSMILFTFTLHRHDRPFT